MPSYNSLVYGTFHIAGTTESIFCATAQPKNLLLEPALPCVPYNIGSVLGTSIEFTGCDART
jgi:hypothetical protein